MPTGLNAVAYVAYALTFWFALNWNVSWPDVLVSSTSALNACGV